MLLKLFKCSPVPASFFPIYELCYIGAETREGRRKAAAVMSSPSSSPFADVIHSLAGLHQEHHQALLDMREDQERRFQTLVRTQQEDRELFRSWMDREVRAGGATPAPAPPTHMPLNKMGPQDDLEAFIDLFERTAEACGWPPANWPVRLIPLLSGEAQLAAQQLPVQNLLVYNDLKRAILQRVGLNPETTSSALPIAGAGGKQPALRDGSTAPGRVPQMAVGWGRRCRPDSGSGGAGAVHRAAPQEDCAVGPVPPADIVGPGHSTGGGPDGGVPWGWRGPSSGLSLSLSPPPYPKPVPLPRSRVNPPPRAPPRWRGGPAPESGGLRSSPRGAGPTGPAGVPDSGPSFSPRQNLDPLPATRAAGKSGPACWRCRNPGHFIDRCPVMEVGALPAGRPRSS